jgi:hypothetical protein
MLCLETKFVGHEVKSCMLYNFILDGGHVDVNFLMFQLDHEDHQAVIRHLWNTTTNANARFNEGDHTFKCNELLKSSQPLFLQTFIKNIWTHKKIWINCFWIEMERKKQFDSKWLVKLSFHI